MKRIISALLAVLIVLTILAPVTTATAAAKKQKVAVKVVDSVNGNLLMYRTVWIYDKNGKKIKDTVTDKWTGIVTVWLAPGEYKITVPKNPTEDYKTASKKFTVVSGKDKSFTLKVVPLKGYFTAMALDKLTGETVKGVTYTLLNGDGSVRYTNKFDGGTRYQLPAGTYRVIFKHANYVNKGTPTVNLKGGDEIRYDIKMTPVYTVKLKIKDKDGTVVKNNKKIHVVLKRSGKEDLSTIPDASGNASFTKIPYGSVTIEVYRTVKGKKDVLYSGTLSVSADKPGGTFKKTIKLNKVIK